MEHIVTCPDPWVDLQVARRNRIMFRRGVMLGQEFVTDAA
jgi:hypothetical protein